jgi:hypothetical protein
MSRPAGKLPPGDRTAGVLMTIVVTAMIVVRHDNYLGLIRSSQNVRRTKR